MFWFIIYTLDILLFIYAAFTVAYLMIYAVASMFSRHNELPSTRDKNRFIIIIPSYKRDAVIEGTVKSILSQTYPQRYFDVVVVSDHQSPLTNFKLAQYPITLLTPDFEKSSK